MKRDFFKIAMSFHLTQHHSKPQYAKSLWNTIFRLIGAVVVLLSTTDVFATESDYETLKDTYLTLQSRLESNDFKNPIVVDSNVNKENVKGIVYAVLPHNFNQTGKLFRNVNSLCNALDFHINVKSCTVSAAQDHSPLLHVYIGNKDYQQPDEAYRFDYGYEVVANEPNYLDIRLNTVDGPLDSKDYQISIQAIPLDNQSSFVVFSYSAVYGLMTRLMINTYLATSGRNKVGFTRVGTDSDGNTKYIKGIEGLLERNAVRYMFAFYSFLDSESYPKEQRMNIGLNRWFELTRQYPRQLYEIAKDEYIDNKQREQMNQQELQLAIKNTSTSNEQRLNSDIHL